MSNDEPRIFFEVQSEYKNICTRKSRDSGNFLADLLYYTFRMCRNWNKNTYVLWKVVINFWTWFFLLIPKFDPLGFIRAFPDGGVV